jgi:hypothetical protein
MIRALMQSCLPLRDGRIRTPSPDSYNSFRNQAITLRGVVRAHCELKPCTSVKIVAANTKCNLFRVTN